MNYYNRMTPVKNPKRHIYIALFIIVLLAGITGFCLLDRSETSNTSDPISLNAYTTTAFGAVTVNDSELWRKDCGTVNPLATWANNDQQLAYFSHDTKTMQFIDLSTGKTLKFVSLNPDLLPNTSVNFFPIRFYQDHLYFKSQSEPFVRIANDGTIGLFPNFAQARSATLKDGAVFPTNNETEKQSPIIQAKINALMEAYGDIKQVSIIGDTALIIHYLNERTVNGIDITFEHKFDVITAIDMRTGDTRWRHRYDFATWIGESHGTPLVGLRTKDGHSIIARINLQNGTAIWGLKIDSFSSEAIHLTPEHLLLFSPNGSASQIDYQTGKVLKQVRVNMDITTGFLNNFLYANDRIVMCSSIYKGSDVTYTLHCFAFKAVNE